MVASKLVGPDDELLPHLLTKWETGGIMSCSSCKGAG